jgi:hypothetical protein
MPVWLLSAIRTAVQAGWSWVVVESATHLGVTLPADTPVWLQPLIVAALVALVTFVIRWLETRPTTSLWGRAARGLARLLMLGIKQQPIGYAAPTEPTGASAAPTDGARLRSP